jgi:hypothetical protein
VVVAPSGLLFCGAFVEANSIFDHIIEEKYKNSATRINNGQKSFFLSQTTWRHHHS